MTKKLEYSKLIVSPFRQPRPALFLDRDGVVIEDCHHICDPEEVRLCRGSLELIKAANIAHIPVVLITNQSGISKGYFEWSDFLVVNQRMQELLGPDAYFSAIYANGYGPDAPAASWRKPSPVMLLEASEALNLDLKHSMIIGDRLSDLQAGVDAGVTRLFHVLSGYGYSSRPAIVEWYKKISDSSRPLIDLLSLTLLDTLDQFPYDSLDLKRLTN